MKSNAVSSAYVTTSVYSSVDEIPLVYKDKNGSQARNPAQEAKVEKFLLIEENVSSDPVVGILSPELQWPWPTNAPIVWAFVGLLYCFHPE